MRFCLISEDARTHNLCRAVLAELFGDRYTLDAAHPASLPGSEADVYIWDAEPTARTLHSVSHESWRHFFLIDRTRLHHVRDLIPFENANILLKPVTKAALSAFLTNLCERYPEREDRSIESLRADRDLILQCLMQTNLKLQEYDQDRTNFLARAIHDFRAPLTALTGYCGLLLGEDVGTLTEEQRCVIERMHRSAKKLSRMSTAMFQLSVAPRIETVLDLESADMNACIEQALHEILPVAQDKRLSISVDCIAPSEPLLFDKAKIEQVLVNLFDNACKFASRGGSLAVKAYPYKSEQHTGPAQEGSEDHSSRGVRQDGFDCYRVDIRDTGPGIPPAHVTRIFEEYTSYGGGGDRSGGGLGLAICRMILNQHKGRIWAESTKSGAVFSFVLPFRHGAAASEPAMSHTVTA